ncbi:MAG: hypothetical protein H0V67_07410 [Geodermatophilaceae bacterium]|nr:hypothetical protein [Geodermatophilaceae bacterium]
MPQQQQQAVVELAEIRAAVKLLEQEEAAGHLSAAETTRRINDCRRAVTPRDLWKASGRRAGSRKRSDWKDIRGAVYGLLFLLALAIVGVYLITLVIAEYVGGEEFVPGMTTSPSSPP